MKSIHYLLPSFIVFAMGLTGCTQADAPLPQLAGHDFIELSKIEKISKFRSAIGGDYSTPEEPCRSMRHLYVPKPKFVQDRTIEIYSPVDGTIARIDRLNLDDTSQLYNLRIAIQPALYPETRYIIEAVDLLSSEFRVDTVVKAGMQIGYAHFEGQGDPMVSIAIRGSQSDPDSLWPFFDTLQDYVFDNYRNRSVPSREAMTISKAERDHDSLQCDDGQITGEGSLENWVILK